MALAGTSLPFGLRDIRLTPMDDSEVLGTPVDLPNSQTFSFSEAEEFETLRGDDGVVAIRGKGPQIEWSLESGGISLAAWKVMSGGTVTVTGSTPNQVRTFRKTKADSKPYFKVEGQALSDSDGDFHGVVYKTRASESLEGEFGDGVFWITSAGGVGVPRADGVLYDFIQNETTTAIP